MSQHQPTRFRISVSPTRKLKPDAYSSNSSENEDNHQHNLSTKNSKTHYVIKQQLMPGSTSSFGSRYSNETAAVRAELAASKLALAQNSLAPKIEFGDDDSPRIEFQQKLS